jgi:hypothetical protein
MDHLSAADSESGAGGNGSGRGQTQPRHRRERLFSHKVTCGQERDGSFLPVGGNNCDLCAAFLKIKDRVCGISLRKEGILWRQLDDSSPQAGARQKGGGIESGLFKFNY